jgi:hypothetical protein
MNTNQPWAASLKVRNHPRDDATRRLDGEVVKPRPENPRCGAFQPSIFDALVDNGELPSLTNLLSHARPVGCVGRALGGPFYDGL